MSNYYYEATHNKDVWVGFNKQEGSYHTSKNYSDETDSKKTNIGTLHNKTENIEDRYFGEPNTTYSQDEKYYKGTPFSPSDGTFHNNQYQPSSQNLAKDWELILFGGILFLAFIKRK